MNRSQLLGKLFPLFVVFTGLALGALIPEYAKVISELGYRFAEPDMATDYVIGVMWAGGIALSIPFWPVPASEKRDLSKLWMIRCFVTLGFMLLYEHSYPLDASYYYTEAQRGSFDFSTWAIGNGLTFITGLAWLMNHALPVYNSYHALKVICSFLGFAGVYIFYRGCVKYSGERNRKLLYCLMLCPSVLFWSSIFGKDPIHWFGIAIYLYGVLCFARTRNVVFLLPMVFGLGINLMLRTWSAIIFVAPFGLVGIWRVKNIVVKIGLIAAFVVALQYGMKTFSSQFGTDSIDSLVARTNYLSHVWNRGGSGQAAPEFTSLASMIKFAPLGMFTALFRPLPGDVMNLFGLIAGLENLLLLSILVLALRRGAMRALRDEMALWGVCLLAIWSLSYGFISYQNLGAAVRFRLQVMPVLVALVLFLSQQSKLYRETVDVRDIRVT